MTRELVDVTAVTVVSGTVVRLTFGDSKSRLVDLRSLMVGPIYDEVFERGIFGDVYVDPEEGTIVWPNGADLPPDRLYRDPIEVHVGHDLAEQIDVVFRQALLGEIRRTGSSVVSDLPAVRPSTRSTKLRPSATRVLRGQSELRGGVSILLKDGGSGASRFDARFVHGRA